ncbi:hypothetical protein IU449_27435 [Nocardia higoensis]|uniref:MobA/VirD2-like nuclease domain-containing protein n=1 Tax=Nocardia higoensis TaxID=228599 RepID=A0ABS0DJA9_9NOCA|nr:hypothetical protein [Nocardia higoensis]MBF6358235.1 hypothetical protein [Nocardia higoensis]
MPNVVKGSDMRGLLRYLAGPGRANEHTNPKVIAGDVVTMAVYSGGIDPVRATELAKLLDSPRQTVLRGAPVLVTNYKKAYGLIDEGMERRKAFEEATRDQNVWHCSLSLGPREGQLDEETWARIARRFMTEMGFTDSAGGAPDVRWTAIHHGLTKAGGDHIHVAMSVVRPDGSLADVRRDWKRSQDAAALLEREFGLQVLVSREDRGTEAATRPDERGRAERVGAAETDREALRRRVRAAAVASETEAEFVAALRGEGMVLRPRFAKGGTDQVVGYAVRMPAQKNLRSGAWEKAVWYGGGQLAKDLTLASLRSWAGWEQSEQAQAAAVAEWGRASTTRSGRAISPDQLSRQDAVWQLSQWSQYMRTIPVEDQDAWAQAASQTAGVFAAASVRTETTPGPLDQLSRQLARAGQLPAHRRRPHGVHGPGMRAVARMLWSTQSPVTSDLALMQALSDCLLTVGDMLAASDRAHAAQVMAGNARHVLTEVHMRLDGLDPTKRYVRDHGSPMWAAEQRARAIVDRVDETSRGKLETEIAAAHDGWKARRIAQVGAGKGPRIDARGQILDAPATPAKPTRRRTAADRLAWLDQETGSAPTRAAGPKPKPAPRQTPESVHEKHSGLGLPHLPYDTDQDRDFER